jgi:hypothetical protein
MKKLRPLLFLLIYTITTTVRADFNDGVVAYLMADYEKAFSTMQSLAETSDHGYAQYYMAMMYLKGQGVDQNYKVASEWFRRASEKNIPQAQYKLGDLYFNGRGVPKDYENAYIWYSVGASHKHELSVSSVKKAKEKLSDDELKEADKVIATYIKKYGPSKDFDPTKPIKVDNE